MSKKQKKFSYKSLKEPLKEEKMSSTELQSEIDKAQKSMDKFISLGNYTNAEKLSDRIEMLKKLLKIQKSKETKNRHKIEKENLNSDKENDIENLNLLWDQKFEELQTRSQVALEELKKHQENELQELYSQYQNEVLEFKPSSTYLKLQKEEEGLVKLKKFKEAQIIRKQKENQALIDSNKIGQNRENTFRCLEKKVKQKYTNELLYLQKKFQAEFDELTLGKQRELEFLNKKYSAKNSDLLKQQKREKNIIINKNYANRISSLTVNNELKYSVNNVKLTNDGINQLYAEIPDKNIKDNTLFNVNRENQEEFVESQMISQNGNNNISSNVNGGEDKEQNVGNEVEDGDEELENKGRRYTE